MGKKQHSKDRMYLTTTEWKHEWGGYKERPQGSEYKRLPFHCCALSFTPFEVPVCTEDGSVFDLINIVPYINKYKRHPVSGQPLALKDLTPLQFHKNAEGEYHDPVLNKVFTAHTHIVAVKTSGNVYAFEAIEELNIKPKFWKDLLTDASFTRNDLIHIQDPQNLRAKDFTSFVHYKQDLKVESAEQETTVRAVSDDVARALTALKPSVKATVEDKLQNALKALKEAKKQLDAQPAAAQGTQRDWRLVAPSRTRDPVVFKPGALTWDTEEPAKPSKKQKRSGATQGQAGESVKKVEVTPKEWYENRVRYTASAHTTGDASRSFTSSVRSVVTKNKLEMIRVDRNPSKKGYVRLHTNLGDLNLELHCDIVPRTCENFLGLCEMGYYNGTVFHRSIKNFMIQGGDPEGTGKGGACIYGKTFKDELDSRLLHSGRGVLSMANSGKDTNGSQFFILYRSARHLDYKHSVFGRVVGGLDVLTLMERVPTDEEDRPQEEIVLLGVEIFSNPFAEMEEEEKNLDQETALNTDIGNDQRGWYSNTGRGQLALGPGSKVGKYLALNEDKDVALNQSSKHKSGVPTSQAAKTLPMNNQQPSNFDSW